MKKIKVRPVAVYTAVCLLFSCVLARIGYIQSSPDAEVAAAVTKKCVSFGVSRGYIYDRNMVPLVNRVCKNTAVILSSPLSLQLLRECTGEVFSETENGILICRETETEIASSPLSLNVKTVERYDTENLCAHILGYTDADGRGVCGMEKAYDRVLNEASGELGVSYSVDARGKILFGNGLQTENNGYDSKAGLVLTVDADIQRVVERALAESDIETGACVVLSVKTGELFAMASVPKYNISDLAASLTDEKSPFLNRALQAYPVGSVFKPFIAAAAIENGTAVNADFVCDGYYTVGDTCFHCYNRKTHGRQQLNDAVCNSCNCYFIDLGLKTGAENITSMCSLFGFGKEIRLASGIVSAAGNLPKTDELSSPAALANLSFGQGELLGTPLQLAAAYACLASGGIYSEPYITKYLVDANGKQYAYYAPENTCRVLDEGVCTVINESLRLNMLEGTGASGAPKHVSSGGKTATAQTGKYKENGTEKLCTWFCGFFPFEEPEYAVCVFNENGVSGDCSPVFGVIADKICSLKKEKRV